ncbi:MAG: FecR domain-containing protein [Polyangiaceae bacterium]
MSAPSCPRLFEAEAMRDGRLGDAQRASFERHTVKCPACAREVQELDRLAGRLRTTLREPGDELGSRRERTRLLAAFDRELLAPKRSGHPAWRRVLWPATAVALMAALLLVWRVRPRGERPARIEALPAVVYADPATAWSEAVDGNREVVTLDHGALSIRVDHAASARRLVVALPDGELEDTGTTFMVSADGGRTTRVAVQEGSVVLRLRGQTPIGVGAGGVWTPAAPPATASERPSGTPPIDPPSATPSQWPSVRPGARTPRVPPSAEVAPDLSADFNGPMAALNRGDNWAAAEGFASFLASHPGDARGEDAAYLRIIALQRCGDGSGTRAAALTYLRRYPTGFRRAEVEALSRR